MRLGTKSVLVTTLSPEPGTVLLTDLRDDMEDVGHAHFTALCLDCAAGSSLALF